MAGLETEDLYTTNKRLVAELTPLDPLVFNKKTTELVTYIKHYKYTMLLCREKYDYTIFRCNKNTESYLIEEDIRACLNNRGITYSIEKQDDGVYEIWIKCFDDETPSVYYLFDYTNGVIDYE